MAWDLVKHRDFTFTLHRLRVYDSLMIILVYGPKKEEVARE